MRPVYLRFWERHGLTPYLRIPPGGAVIYDHNYHPKACHELWWIHELWGM